MDVPDTTFQTDVVERSRTVPVVVDFWAEWCGPCRQLGPVLERAVAARDGQVELAKVDVDANPGVARAGLICARRPAEVNVRKKNLLIRIRATSSAACGRLSLTFRPLHRPISQNDCSIIWRT